MRIPRTATIAIAVVTAAVWLITALMGADSRAAVIMGVIPARLSGLIEITPAVPAWLTPLSSTLVHGGALHLALNLLMLIWCGTKVERILGAGPVIFLYLVGAYTAAIAQWLSSPVSPTPMIGASGAISAIIGAFALSFGQQKRLVSSPSLNRTLNALWLLAAWVALQIMTGLLAGVQGFLLATPAHIGGFIAGLLLQRPLLLWRYRSA
ncbi:MAG TPA: rhomboid family intramembrane serine protease [Sphingomicrobium sp.]|nr:rhomboid family intramembrane serine protease [Sphingomicrobium sp.]